MGLYCDFMIRAAISHERWRPPPELRTMLYESAFAYWYGPQPLDRNLQATGS